MEAKIGESSSSDPVQSFFDFNLRLSVRSLMLLRLKRAGWLVEGLKLGETAGHFSQYLFGTESSGQFSAADFEPTMPLHNDSSRHPLLKPGTPRGF
jgi:hypothetical protein